jgi:HEAT repeat protein
MREVAASALGRLGPAAQEAIPALIKLLEDPDPGIRRAAAAALRQVKAEATDAVQAEP